MRQRYFYMRLKFSVVFHQDDLHLNIELYDECKSQYEQRKRKDAQERSIRDAEWQKILSGAK